MISNQGWSAVEWLKYHFGMNQNKVLVTGATGLVGRRLISKFQNVCVTSRNVSRAKQTLGDSATDFIEWPAVENPPNLQAAEPLSTVINLMGEPIVGRWTAEKKKRLRDSRILGTRSLIAAIESMARKPDVLVSASAVGFYGDGGNQEINEKAGPGSGFLADLCDEWENEARKAEELGVRVVILRIGIVLSPDGGALKQMLPIFRTGLAGPLGNGRQYFPWIHLDDLVGLFHWAATDSNAKGVYNATAPTPVTNREFTRCLASVLRRPAFLPAPKFALKIAMGEFANSLFVSHRVVPEAAIRDGFEFQHPDLEPALRDLI